MQRSINLFKGSHGYSNGEQRRDFIHVDDTVSVNNWFRMNPDVSGIYNVGTGMSRTFNDIAKNVLEYYQRGAINYIDFPNNLEKLKKYHILYYIHIKPHNFYPHELNGYFLLLLSIKN